MHHIVLVVVISAQWLLLSEGQTLQAKEYRYDYEYSSEAKGWLNFHEIPGTWREARMRCHAEGAVLASPLTKKLKTAIISFVSRHTSSESTIIFTGVHASFSKGDYSSIEGVPLRRLSITWAAGEPDNFEDTESCLSMTTDQKGSMADVKCTKVLPYVCYKKDTLLTPTSCGTTDPEYILDARTGNCYKFHTRGLPWSQAYMTCMAEGGHLVIINSETEAQVVKEMHQKYSNTRIRSSQPDHLAIGVHDWGEHQTWLTIHGETLDAAGYQLWRNGEPSNRSNDDTGDPGEFCGSVHRSATFNDIWCNMPVPFLCEKSRDSLLRVVQDRDPDDTDSDMVLQKYTWSWCWSWYCTLSFTLGLSISKNMPLILQYLIPIYQHFNRHFALVRT